jgi:hypothetical protein
MNNKVFTSQDEGFHRSREEALNLKATQQVRNRVLNLKNAVFEEFLGKTELALWYKGHQSIINLYPTS